MAGVRRLPHVPRVLRRITLPFLALAVLLIAAPAAHAGPLKPPAKKFLAQQDRLVRQFAPDQAGMLSTTARMKTELRKCPALKDLPNDGFEQIKSFLYVLLDLIQESSAPYHDDIVSAMNEYKIADYGDPVLNRAARARYKHLKVISELKPFDSCDVLNGWDKAGWPTDYAPSGDLGDAVRGIYYPDLQLPDETSLVRRLRKLGASPKQLRRISHPEVATTVLDAWDGVARPMFPLASKKWLQWR